MYEDGKDAKFLLVWQTWCFMDLSQFAYAAPGAAGLPGTAQGNNDSQATDIPQKEQTAQRGTKRYRNDKSGSGSSVVLDSVNPKHAPGLDFIGKFDKSQDIS